MDDFYKFKYYFKAYSGLKNKSKCEEYLLKSLEYNCEDLE